MDTDALNSTDGMDPYFNSAATTTSTATTSSIASNNEMTTLGKQQPYRKIYLKQLPRMMQIEDLTAEIDEHLTQALLKLQYSDITFSTTILKSKVEPETTNNAGTGFIRISLCDQDALKVAQVLCQHSVGDVDDESSAMIVATVPKAAIALQSKAAKSPKKEGPNEKTLSKQRNRDRKFHKLREFIERIPLPSTEFPLSHCADYYEANIPVKKLGAEQAADTTATTTASFCWVNIPDCVDPAHNFIRNEPLGHNVNLELFIRENDQKKKVQKERKEEHGIQTKSYADTTGTAVPGRNSAISGSEGLTTRAMRKRYQIESFFLALRQIIIPPGVLPPPTTHTTEDGDNDVEVENATESSSSSSSSAQQQQQQTISSSSSSSNNNIKSSNISSRRLRIVDFGSGSGNLCLPLAYLFPEHDFVAVDMKPSSINILLKRSAAAGLTNMRAHVMRIEAYKEPFDIALALHACGSATDFALWQAECNRAAYIMCPCCIGNLSFKPSGSCSGGGGGGSSSSSSDNSNSAVSTCIPCSTSNRNNATKRVPSAASSAAASLPPPPPPPSARDDECGLTLTHPRSLWLSNELGEDLDTAEALFNSMVKSGDISHGSAHSSAHSAVFNAEQEKIARKCKCFLEMDRNAHMAEAGYETILTRLLKAELTGKGDLLVGVPKERISEGIFQWPTSWKSTTI